MQFSVSTLALLLLPTLTLSAPTAPKPSPPVGACPAPPPSSTSSTPAPTSTPAPPPPFTLMSVRSASPIHYGQVNAAGQRFYINRGAATYCPGGVVPCDQFQNDTTVLAMAEANKPSGASLYDTVPGGQSIFVTKEGELGFTQAHSASIPAGAYTTGFVYTPPANDQPWGYFSFTAAGATGLVACPVAGSTVVYQVFANVTGKDTSKCLGFSAFALAYSGKTAWQYT